MDGMTDRIIRWTLGAARRKCELHSTQEQHGGMFGEKKAANWASTSTSSSRVLLHANASPTEPSYGLKRS